MCLSLLIDDREALDEGVMEASVLLGEMNPTLTTYMEQTEVAQKESKTALNVVSPCLSCLLSHLVDVCLFLCSRSYASF